MTPLEQQLEPFRSQYPPSMLEDFLDYWDETNAKGKAKWQLEKTWEIGRRLKRWKRQQDKWQWEKEQRNALKLVEERPVHREPVQERKDVGFQGMGQLVNKWKV